MFKSFIGFLLLFCVFNQQSIAADRWLTKFAQDIQLKAQKKNLPGYTFAYIEKGKPASVVVYGKESSQATLLLSILYSDWPRYQKPLLLC